MQTLETQDDRFTIIINQVYTKGDLKGYVDGVVRFNYMNRERDHEFLFRFDDDVNGSNFKLVTIDYGYKVPFIDGVWGTIEGQIKQYVDKTLHWNLGRHH